MSQPRPLLSLVALLGIPILVATSLIGCTSSDTTDQPVKPDRATTKRGGAGPARHDSPQAAYDAAKAATQAKDYTAFSHCLTPGSCDIMAGGMIRVALFMKELAAHPLGGPEGEQDKQDLAASCKALDDVLARHGMKEDQLEAIQALDPAAPPEEGMAALAKLTTPIKDKSAFLVEIMNAMDAIESAHAGSPGGTGKSQTTGMFGGRLESIKVEGDHAAAQVVMALGDEERRLPIGFRKVNDSWLIELIVPGRN